MWMGCRKRPVSAELAELGRWAQRVAHRVDAVTRQANALQREAHEKASELQALRERSERELQPSKVRDELIANIDALKQTLTSIAGAPA